ncbi:factor-independent urate hydroxylase [Anatilimnocola floriformis]|uniref:factor-independent urate hydroxylase n=1 Tax=Anatilimnocola floriformis TaxID=2948575 RepID=UPI0020C36120|nr:urate oxidase [Anatilimnocola floriformis]
MAHLQSQSYGKSRVRLSHIERKAERHEFLEVTTAISLDGDFAAAFTSADNHLIVATDTMKNTVYLLAHEHGVPSIEAFGLRLAQHFLDQYPHVTQVRVSLEEKPWQRLAIAGEPHPHSFVATSERHICEIAATRTATKMTSGMTDLQVLKTTGSGFANFHRDEYTSLPETNDRIFATTIEANWPCSNLPDDWSTARQNIRAAILKIFAENFSPSVQATLFEMAEAAFVACSQIDEITITMPNQHHIPFNFTPFGKTNANITFIPTDEPHGLISGTVRRGEKKC